MRILGTGSYAPGTVASNEDFTRFVETSDEWITTRTGIKERHIATQEPTWEMGLLAGKSALEQAGVSPEELDLVLVSTVTSDFYSPSMSCLIGAKLGAVNALCFDVNGACTGFVYGLDIAHKYLLSGMKKILVIGTERLSKMTNYSDRSTCVLFGDGAGAAVVEAGENRYASYLRSDGNGAKLLYAVAPSTKNPFSSHPVSPGEEFPYEVGSLFMDGKEVYKFAIKAMPEAVNGACQKFGISPAQLDLIIPHQANIRIVQTAAKGLSLPMEKFAVNLERYGNTSSASIPLCLDEMCRAGRVKRGDVVCLVGFGAGLTYGASVFEY